MQKIKIVGCGGSGTNILNSLIEREGFKDERVEFYVINSDEASLKRAKAKNKISIGYGFGCGGNTTGAKQYLEQSNTEIKNILKDTDLLILTTGMGGGTGTAAVCEIAKMAKEQNIPTIAVISIPFTMEGLPRTTTAENGIKELKEYTSAIIVFKNDNIFNYIYENAYFDMIFGFIDGIIIGIINSITTTIGNSDVTSININDLKYFIKTSNQVILKKGTGLTVAQAFNNAVKNNICESFDMSKTNKILVTLVGNNGINISDMKQLDKEIKNSFPNIKLCKIQDMQKDTLYIKIILILFC